MSIIEKQRAAQHRLHHGTTRTEPELAHYRRNLTAVPLVDVEVPKIALVRFKDQDPNPLVLLGEIAQRPGHVVVFDAQIGGIRIVPADQLELAPPDHIE